MDPDARTTANVVPGELPPLPGDVTDERNATATAELLAQARAARDLAQESERRFRALADELPQMVFIVDEDGAYSFVNRRFTELSGLDLAALNRGEWKGSLHPDDLPEMTARWERALAEGAPFEMEFRQRGRDSSFRWFRGRALPLRDASGKVTQFLGTHTDIEGRKREEQEHAALRARALRAEAAEEGLRLSDKILQHIPDAVVLADLDGRIRRWSGGAASMFGYSAEEATGRDSSFVHPPDVRQRVSAEIERALLATGAYSGELSALRKDGTVFPIELKARLLADAQGTPVAFLGLSRDLARAKEAERQRLQLIAEQSARALAEAGNRQKDEFLAMLGHELRNPLAPIVTALDLLRLRGHVGREQEVIERQVGHMVRLVDDLLDVSRIARGKVDLKKSVVELSRVVAQAIEMASPLFEQKRQELVVQVPREGLSVDCDPTRISQVVSNLLNNAARYTLPGGHVRVSAEREGGEAVLRVRDDGRGIGPALLPHIFDLFVQGERGPGVQGGLGLGLAIVRNLVELHGGTVGAASEGPERGSEFVVRLPLAPCPAPEAEDARSVMRLPSSGARERVLVVDDNVDAAEVLAEVLRLDGHEVRTAYDGLSALEEASRFSPETIFCDIGLPVMDGYEVARTLRAAEATRGVRLIAISGYGLDSDRRRAMEAGFEGFLMKPIDLLQVAAVVARPSPPAGRPPL